MKRSALVFIFIFGVVHSFSANDMKDEFLNPAEDLALANENEDERIGVHSSRKSGPTSLAEGSVCDKDKDDCQCYGKWHKCSCPWFWQSGPCTCQEGYKHTCITKLSCPNKNEWGLDWRSEEQRSPC